jgi:hypothetical protein
VWIQQIERVYVVCEVLAYTGNCELVKSIGGKEWRVIR